MKRKIRLTLTVLMIGGLLAACAATGPMESQTALRYTFNVKIGDRQIRRSWIWEPGPDRVVLKAEDGGADYNRREVAASETLRSVDARFINDNYWFLFPLHVYWDADAAVTDAGKTDYPIGPGTGRRVVVSYPVKVGYTPADVYEIFLDDDFRIREWIYRKGGATAPTRITTWEDYRRLGPLTVSLDHRSADGSFRLWFTDVGVRLKGEKTWRAPK